MNVPALSHTHVTRLLTMEACIEVMADALRATSQGGAVLPLRSLVWMPDRTGMIGLMPDYLEQSETGGRAPRGIDPPRSLGLKVVSIFPGNHAAGYDSHQGVVML